MGALKVGAPSAKALEEVLKLSKAGKTAEASAMLTRITENGGVVGANSHEPFMNVKYSPRRSFTFEEYVSFLLSLENKTDMKENKIPGPYSNLLCQKIY